MESNREKVSYCIGLEAGRNIKDQFKEIDGTLVMEGFADSILGKNPKLAMDEIREILTALQKQIQEQQKAFVEQLASKNLEEGEAFLSDNKSEDGVVALPSGLQYKVLESGSGKSPSMHAEVSVHYRGSLLNGTVFDSSYERDQPQTFPVSKVIAGWSEALKKMKVGDKWQIFVPPYLAYGESGYGPQIEPNSTLIFEMELLGIKET